MVRKDEVSGNRSLKPGEKTNEFAGAGEKADIEFTKDPSITHNGIKFALGTEGSFKGNPYEAACKFRTKNVVFDKDFGNYKVKIPYLTMAQFIAWLREPENLKKFNEQVELEKQKVIGVPVLT